MEKMKEHWFEIVAGVLVLAAVAFLAVALWGHRSAGGRAEDECRQECPKYGAEYSAVTKESLGGSFQCWCKRIRQPAALLPREPGTDCVVFDTDHGTVCKKLDQEYEPLRIW